MVPLRGRRGVGERARGARRLRLRAASAGVLLAFVLVACPAEPEPGIAPERVGDPDRGREAFVGYGCAACHSVTGLREARGVVAPDLDGFAGQRLIAGSVHNHPDRLIDFILAPQEVVPGTLMPDVGVDEDDAPDIAAFLYTLR